MVSEPTPRHTDEPVAAPKTLLTTPAALPERAADAPRSGERTEPFAVTAAQETPPPLPAPPRSGLDVGVPGYEILGELGRGGMGVVYKARHLQLNRLVALKMVLAGGCARPEDLLRFLGEAQAAAGLQHPNIIQIHEVDQHCGLPYFTLEYVSGGSLAKKLAHEPQPPADAARLALVLAGAIQHAHCQGIVHRDLKPANVLLTADGEAKIADFGLAKRLDGGGAVTQSGALLGTPSYMAPEQAEGKTREVGPAVDVYALGAILYELLTGRPPFQGPTIHDTLAQVLSVEPVSVRRLQPRVPRDLETICLKCLQKDISGRYASAAELAEDLRRFLAGEPIRARPVGMLERGWKWLRRRPSLAAVYGLALLVLLLLSGVAGVMSLWWSEEAARRRSEQAAAEAQGRLGRQERRAYADQVRLAAASWRAGDPAAANETLAACAEAHRGWEWDYLQRELHREQLILRDPADEVQALAFNRDGSGLLTISARNQVVRLWDADSGKQTAVLDGQHTGRVTAACFSPDGRRVATASQDKTARLWDADSGKELFPLVGHGAEVVGVCFSPDGGRILTASRDRSARLWDATTGQLLHVLAQHTAEVTCACFSPDGRRAATASNDRTARLWDVESGQELAVLKGHTGELVSICFDADGRRAATASRDGTTRLWDVETGRTLFVLEGRAGELTGVCFSPDGRRIAAASRDGSIRVWDATSGAVRTVLTGCKAAVEGVCFSPDGGRVLATAADRTVRLWDAVSGEALGVWSGRGDNPAAACFSPDGARVAVAALDRTAQILDVAYRPSSAFLLIARRVQKPVHLGFSADSRRLVAVGAGSTRQVWDAASGKELAADEAGRTWEASADERKADLHGRGDSVRVAAFSVDGSRMITAGDDRMVRFWDMASGLPVLGLDGGGDRIESACFSPDGSRAAAAAADGTIRLWIARETKEQERVRRRAWREQQAVQAEAAREWFAAAFHRAQLVRASLRQGNWVEALTVGVH
jgi:WD40 repeat protein/tRNA A-37 threonylcarbamoyl transferase component Bud32